MSITASELDELVQTAHEAAENDDSDKYNPFADYGNIWSALKYGDVEYPVSLSDEVFITGTVAEHGGEGQGEEYWVVVSVATPSGTQLFRKDGWYASYDGGYLDGDTYEVAPVEKIVTYYEKKD